MEQLDALRKWYRSLPSREQWMVLGTSILVIVTLFYVMVWEPMHVGLNEQEERLDMRMRELAIMQESANEAKMLRASGGGIKIKDSNKPAALVIEQSLTIAGLKSSVKKIESSDADGARVTLDDAPFDQVLVWLDTLATHNNIHVVSANIERADKEGIANARLTFERPQ